MKIMIIRIEKLGLAGCEYMVFGRASYTSGAEVVQLHPLAPSIGAKTPNGCNITVCTLRCMYQ